MERLSQGQRDNIDSLDAPFLIQGLIPNSRSMAAHTRHVALLLRDGDAPCAEAMAYLTNLFERSVPVSAHAQLACAKGCAFCCNQPVIVNAPEAIFVAASQAARGRVALIGAAVLQLEGRRADTPRVLWIGCPMLTENSCSAYVERPLSCHGYVSVRVEDCLADHLQPGTAVVRAPAAYNDLRQVCRRILLTALRASGHSSDCYEMNAAVVLVLETDNAERRWLGGENIFARLPVMAPASRETDISITRMAAAIAPTL